MEIGGGGVFPLNITCSFGRGKEIVPFPSETYGINSLPLPPPKQTKERKEISASRIASSSNGQLLLASFFRKKKMVNNLEVELVNDQSGWQNFVKALAKSSKECESSLKNEYTKERASQLQTFKGCIIPATECAYDTSYFTTRYIRNPEEGDPNSASDDDMTETGSLYGSSSCNDQLDDEGDECE